MPDTAIADGVSVPTGNPLMEAVARGPEACAVWRERFAAWTVAAVLPKVVMNAVDPLLLFVVLGTDEALRWVPPLVRHYEALRADVPGPFADVERSWRDQRDWWRKYVDPQVLADGIARLAAEAARVRKHPLA